MTEQQRRVPYAIAEAVALWLAALSIGSTDVRVRQEWAFLPGIVRSRFVWGQAHRGQGTLRLVSSSPSVDSVAVHLPATVRSSAVDTTLALSPR